MRAVAKALGLWVVVPFYERAMPGELYNAAVLVDAGHAVVRGCVGSCARESVRAEVAITRAHLAGEVLSLREGDQCAQRGADCRGM